MKKSIGKRVIVLTFILGVMAFLIGMCGIFALQGAEEDMRIIIETYQNNPEFQTPLANEIMQEHAIKEISIMNSNRIVLTSLYGVYFISSIGVILIIHHTVAKPTKKNT